MRLTNIYPIDTLLHYLKLITPSWAWHDLLRFWEEKVEDTENTHSEEQPDDARYANRKPGVWDIKMNAKSVHNNNSIIIIFKVQTVYTCACHCVHIIVCTCAARVRTRLNPQAPALKGNN